MNILDNIFPKQCLMCSRVGFDICPNCLVKIPHSLPCCCVCNNINNGYLSHRYCTDLNIQCFTGWYLPKSIEYKLNRKKKLEIYSVHRFLLSTLINYLNISNLVNYSKISPIPVKGLYNKKLNLNLARSLKSKKRENILFVGERLEDIEWLEKEKGLLLKKSQIIYVLTLFNQTPHPLDQLD